MATQESRPKIEMEPGTLKRGNRICATAVKRSFSDYSWIMSNFPGEQQTAMRALLNHLIRATDYLDLESPNGLSLDVWCEFRDELSDAFMDNFSSADLVSLIDVCRRYNVPKQYLFDMLEGVDTWIRDRAFKTFDDLKVFACRFGGAALTAAVPVAGFVKQGYEESAMQAGQSIFLTQVLANIVQDMKLNKMFIAAEDILETELSISRVKVRQPSDGLKHLVRLYGSRIEKLMYQGGHLIEYLDFDARRSFTSLLAVHWTMLMKMRVDPNVVLNPDGVLTKREMFKLKTMHILGLEGNLPVIPLVEVHH